MSNLSVNNSSSDSLGIMDYLDPDGFREVAKSETYGGKTPHNSPQKTQNPPQESHSFPHKMRKVVTRLAELEKLVTPSLKGSGSLFRSISPDYSGSPSSSPLTSSELSSSSSSPLSFSDSSSSSPSPLSFSDSSSPSPSPLSFSDLSSPSPSPLSFSDLSSSSPSLLSSSVSPFPLATSEYYEEVSSSSSSITLGHLSYVSPSPLDSHGSSTSSSFRPASFGEIKIASKENREKSNGKKPKFKATNGKKPKSKIHEFIVTNGVNESEGLKHLVSYEPALPSREKSISHINHINEEIWITSHEGGVEGVVGPRETARYVAERVRRIDFWDEFAPALKRCIQSTIPNLTEIYSGKFDPSKHSIVLVEGGKSNKWIAEVALKLMKFKASAYYRLGTKDARDFIGYIDSLSASKLVSFRKEVEGKSIVLFDDGSYSGKQITDHIQALYKAQVTYKLNFSSIIVYIPYLTPRALGLLEELRNLAPKKTPLILGRAVEIPTLGALEEVHRSNIQRMWYPTEGDGLDRIGLIWLQFKVPNYQSFPAPLVRGSVYGATGTSTIPKSYPLVKDFPSLYKKD